MYHPGYGLHVESYRSSFPGWREVELRVDAEPAYMAAARDPREYPAFCTFVTNPGCDRMCEVVYGSLEACYDGGMLRP